VDKPDPRLAALTGEAIKLMVEAGASAEVVGHFAVNYPSIVAAKLEPLPPPAPDIDLEAVIRATVQTVLGASLAGSVQPLEAQRAGTPRRGARDVERVKLNVTVGGKRTSVKLRASLFEKLATLEGHGKVEALVQGFVDRTPAGHPNRSAWVEEQTAQLLVLSEMRPDRIEGH